jgi:hypothetical protein
VQSTKDQGQTGAKMEFKKQQSVHRLAGYCCAVNVDLEIRASIESHIVRANAINSTMNTSEYVGIMYTLYMNTTIYK